jgi:hypothetical protein
MKGASRLDAIVATGVGVLALLVSAYTAYIQREQVRAQVLPILEYFSSAGPEIRFEVLNKGVGPALVRHVIVTVDGHPARSWSEALDLLLGPGKHHFAQSQLANRAMSPGETLQVLIPHDDEGNTLHPGTPGSLGNRFDAERGRVGVEICYCSTLGDCWTLVAGEHRSPRTTETRRCPKPSDLSFQQ